MIDSKTFNDLMSSLPKTLKFQERELLSKILPEDLKILEDYYSSIKATFRKERKSKDSFLSRNGEDYHWKVSYFAEELPAAEELDVAGELDNADNESHLTYGFEEDEEVNETQEMLNLHEYIQGQLNESNLEIILGLQRQLRAVNDENINYINNLVSCQKMLKCTQETMKNYIAVVKQLTKENRMLKSRLPREESERIQQEMAKHLDRPVNIKEVFPEDIDPEAYQGQHFSRIEDPLTLEETVQENKTSANNTFFEDTGNSDPKHLWNINTQQSISSELCQNNGEQMSEVDINDGAEVKREALDQEYIMEDASNNKSSVTKDDFSVDYSLFDDQVCGVVGSRSDGAVGSPQKSVASYGVELNHSTLQVENLSGRLRNNFRQLLTKKDCNKTSKLSSSSHRKKRYKCHKCPKSFLVFADFNTHLKTHTPLKPFSCDYCEKSFTRAYDLKIHLRIHTGDKPHQCGECDKSFYRSCDVTVHKKKAHTDERSFKCSECVKSFRRSRDLIIHFRTHTGEKLYKCSECNKLFSQNNLLKIHFKKYHESTKSLS